MIRTTRWEPDTCKCVIRYTFDDATSDANRTLSFKDCPFICSYHQNLATAQDVYNAVSEENPRKNAAIQKIIDTYSSMAADSGDKDASGNSIKTYDPTGLSWAFDASRILKITIAAGRLNELQKSNLRLQMGQLSVVGITLLRLDKIEII